MITLKQYKNHLIDTYTYEMDNLNDKKEERKRKLESKYSDEDLTSIIFDTYSFARDVLDIDTVKEGYCKIPLEENTTEYVSLGLIGAHHSDTLFTDPKGRKISKYVARQFFGDYFYIDIDADEYEEVDGDIGSFHYDYYLYMQGINNIEELKEEADKILGINSKTEKPIIKQKKQS